MRKFSDAPLCPFDLAHGIIALWPVTQGDRMRKRVIADPVAGLMRLLHQIGGAGLVQISSDEKKCRENLRLRESIEHAFGNARRRAIVKGECDTFGSHFGSFGSHAEPSYASTWVVAKGKHRRHFDLLTIASRRAGVNDCRLSALNLSHSGRWWKSSSRVIARPPSGCSMIRHSWQEKALPAAQLGKRQRKIFSTGSSTT